MRQPCAPYPGMRHTHRSLLNATFAIGALAFSASQVHAQNTSGCWQTGWQSGQPVLVCGDTPRDPSGYQDMFTAIAVSDSTLNWGSSWAYLDLQAAERNAMARCSKTGAKDCKIQISGQNMCVALATSGPDKAWATESDRNGEKAKAKAIASCRKAGGTRCAVPTWPCAHDAIQ